MLWKIHRGSDELRREIRRSERTIGVSGAASPLSLSGCRHSKGLFKMLRHLNRRIHCMLALAAVCPVFVFAVSAQDSTPDVDQAGSES